MSENEGYPDANELLALYDEIEKTAKDTLLSGNAVGNILISPEYKDPRHFISVDFYLPASPVRDFLSKAISAVAEDEKGFVANDKLHLHLSLPEIWQSPEGRKQAGIGTDEVRAYYKALRDNLPDFKPLTLRLERIMLSADAPLSKDQPDIRSLALIAVFVNKDNNIYKIGKEVYKAIKTSGLKTSTPRHTGKVLYVSLGRFANPPSKTPEGYPILTTLEKLNSEMPLERNVVFEKMEMISTGIKTILSSGHVFVSPPIELQKEKRPNVEPIFLRPKSRPL